MRYINKFIIFSFSSLFLLFSHTVQAANQTPASISQAISTFLENDLNTNDFTISRIDKRLRLKACSKKLLTSFPPYAEELGRTTVEVSCNGYKPWKILISVYIHKYLNVFSTKHSLPSGSIIQKSDLKLIRKDVSKIRSGYFTQLDQLANTVVRRPLRAGKVISPSMLKPKRLVQRGDEIFILAKTKHLTIKVKGKALMNGFLGQRIKVKNIHSKRIFQATVISSGLVKVNM